MVVGRGERSKASLRQWQRSLADRVGDRAPDLDVLVVSRETAAPAESGERATLALPPWKGMAGALALSVVTTLLALPLAHSLELANIVMLFLLAVVVTAMLFGRGPAVLAAVANVLAFDFFFVPPRCRSQSATRNTS